MEVFQLNRNELDLTTKVKYNRLIESIIRTQIVVDRVVTEMRKKFYLYSVIGGPGREECKSNISCEKFCVYSWAFLALFLSFSLSLSRNLALARRKICRSRELRIISSNFLC